MLVVVRCPVCRGASRVEDAAIGLTVACPHCGATFLAVEASEPAPPDPAPPYPTNPALTLTPTPPSQAEAVLASADRAGRTTAFPPSSGFPSPSDQRQLSGPNPPPDASAQPESQPERSATDDLDDPQSPLPASVLIGLALLPFLIPIFWLIAPVVFGEPPVLSLATPIALAVSACTLCLAVIGTIDWTPATRIKGVLILICLSYFTGLTLYFLRKEMLDEVKRFLGAGHNWVEFKPPGAGFQVRLPAGHQPLPHHQPLGLAVLNCRQGQHRDGLGQVYTVVVGWGKPVAAPFAVAPNRLLPGSDDWFDLAGEQLVDRAGGKVVSTQRVRQQEAFPGREWEIRLGETGTMRVVRLFVVRDRILYLSVEGPGVHAGDDLTLELFSSLLISEDS